MPNEPSLGELTRIIKEFRGDVRDDLSAINARVRDDFQAINARLDTFLLREVYNADKAALQERLTRMEREAEAARSAARTAIYSCIGAIVAAIIVGVVMAVLVKGGGSQ